MVLLIFMMMFSEMGLGYDSATDVDASIGMDAPVMRASVAGARDAGPECEDVMEPPE
jgi:hypothetical protein